MAITTSTAANQVANGALVATGALTFNEILMLIGLGISVATFAVNFYFQHRRLKLMEDKDK